MKIKTDFVTNSSSTCFVVMGVNLDREQILNFQDQEIDEVEDWYELIENMIQGSDLEFSFGPDYYNDEVMIGIGYTQMKDDETLGQFKQRVRNQLREKVGFDGDVYHIEEGWMDG